jgi:hypothetical protein
LNDGAGWLLHLASYSGSGQMHSQWLSENRDCNSVWTTRLQRKAIVGGVLGAKEALDQISLGAFH